MEEIEEIDPSDDEYWKMQDLENNSTSSYESNCKLSGLWRRGVNLGKKMVVTGVVVSSASFVLPPLVVLSAIGFAFSVPAGFVIVSYACGEKLLDTLLPMPLALSYQGNAPVYSGELEEYVVYGGDVDKGYEEDEDVREGIELGVGLAEENNIEIDDHDQTFANEENKRSSKVSEIVEEWEREEDLGEYNEDEEQPLNSKMIPEILKGIKEAENEISVMEKEEGWMPRVSLGAIVGEAQVGSENENDAEDMAFVGGENKNNIEQKVKDLAFVVEENESSVDQTRGYKSLGEYIEDEEQPLGSIIIAELLEGIREEENEILFMEKEENGIPKDSSRAVLEVQVGAENEDHVEHVMEDMAFASIRNIEYKENLTGIEEDELDRKMLGLIKEMSDEDINDQKRKQSPAEETHEENEELGRAPVKDMSQDKGNKNLTIIPKEVKEADNNEISFMEEREREIPRDSLWLVVIEPQVSGENENNIEQVLVDMASLGGESENNVEQVRGNEEDVGEHMEDEAENEILAGIKWAENEISLIEKDEGGMPTNSLRAVVLEAQVNVENENNIKQVKEDVAFIIPTTAINKENGYSGNDADLEEGELRRETTGLIEKMRDEGKNVWKRKDSLEKEALEKENMKFEKEYVNDVSDDMGNMGNKNLTVIFEEPKPVMGDKGTIQELKSDVNLNNTSIEGDEGGLVYYEEQPAVQSQLGVNVNNEENYIATELHQGFSLDNLGTSTSESGFNWSDNGTEEPDEFADSFDVMPEGDDVSLNNEVEVTVDYHEVVIESLPVSETAETKPDQGTASASSDKVKLDEEKIWEQINAMRTIVGYKNAPHSSCAEELKALYVFTGVEPPATCKGPADLADINENLHFLMSIIGVK